MFKPFYGYYVSLVNDFIGRTYPDGNDFYALYIIIVYSVFIYTHR